MKTGAAAEIGNVPWLLKPAVSLLPLESESAHAELAEISEAAAEAGLPRLERLLAGGCAAAAFLAAAFDLSPYLRDVARRRPEFLDRLFDAPVAARLDAILAEIAGVAFDAD